MAEINLGTLYDINKELMKKEPVLDPIALSKKLDELVNQIKEYRYAMLLCHERRDYTLFDLTGFEWSLEELKRDINDTLKNRGTVLAIDLQNTGAYEIWIRDLATEECFAYYLFNYEYGVIEVGRD
jgi:hypothetical protein